MAATHVVTLFLPQTLKFYDKEEEERPSSPKSSLKSEKRISSVLHLPSRNSAPNLFHGPTPPHTPGLQFDDGLFSPHMPEKRHFGKPGSLHSLVRSDAEVPEFGPEMFNQPRSRAGPLPSGSILDFAKVHQQLQEQKLHDPKKRVKSPPLSQFASRAQSSERSYESKTWTVEPALQGNGGLVNAVRSAAVASPEVEISWIGTLGFPTDALPDSVRYEVNDHMLNEYHSEVVYLRDRDFNGHYSHFCKTILWPIFHYQVPDHPKSKAYADHSWEFYKNVNQAFADKVIVSYRKGDIIWVHDYHLLLVPGMVRAKLPDAQIGFFLHSAFPSSEVFRCLARRKDLLDGMLGANLVAFQTEEYAQHFLQTCSRLLTVETTVEGVQLDAHFVNVTSQSIGINPPAVQEARQSEEVQKNIQEIQKKYEGKMLIVARDKLDHIHGVRQKLLAFELFLRKYPEWIGKVVLIQVALPTAENAELLTTVSDICHRIEQIHPSLIEPTLVFLQQDIEFDQYFALLTVADVLMISALRDGMNLQAHDFIFCQDGADGNKKHGPLILSEFTGSAALFRDHIPINPWDYQGQADAINQALRMSDIEKERRWRNLHAAVMNQTGGHWAEELGKSLAKVHGEHHQQSSTSVPRLSTVQVSEKYKASSSRVVILDYEGTLAPHKARNNIPLTSPTRIVDTINDLMTDPKNKVYIMSGLQVRELDAVFRTATGVGVIAENGCFYREYGAEPHNWKSLVNMDEVRQWKKDVKAILNYYVDRMEKSRIEERYCSLLFHYSEVEDQEAAVRSAGECADQINAACKSYRIQAIPVGGALMIQMVDYNKGTAAANIYDNLCTNSTVEGKPTPDFLMVVGDDREDEVVFRWANGLSSSGALRNVFTVSVGKRNTEAQAALTQGSTGLLTVLQKLAKISMDATPADYFSSPRKQVRVGEPA